MGCLAGNDIKFDFSGLYGTSKLNRFQSKTNLLRCNSKFFKIERVPRLIGNELGRWPVVCLDMNSKEKTSFQFSLSTFPSASINSPKVKYELCNIDTMRSTSFVFLITVVL